MTKAVFDLDQYYNKLESLYAAAPPASNRAQISAIDILRTSQRILESKNKTKGSLESLYSHIFGNVTSIGHIGERWFNGVYKELADHVYNIPLDMSLIQHQVKSEWPSSLFRAGMFSRLNSEYEGDLGHSFKFKITPVVKGNWVNISVNVFFKGNGNFGAYIPEFLKALNDKATLLFKGDGVYLDKFRDVAKMEEYIQVRMDEIQADLRLMRNNRKEVSLNQIHALGISMDDLKYFLSN